MVNRHHHIFFPGLDTIRFFAAMMVFCAHAVYPAFQLMSVQNELLIRFVNAICSGMIGVSVFFVLSGFLITYLLFDEKEKTKSISLKHFYIRRILRIWPLFYVVLILIFIIYPVLKQAIHTSDVLKPDSNPIYYFVFLGNFDVLTLKIDEARVLLAQNNTWSIAVEEQFYLFWPLLFVLFPKKHYLKVIITTILFSVVFRLYHHKEHFVLYMHTFSVLVSLSVGGLFAYLMYYISGFKHFIAKNQTRVFFTALLLGLLLLMYNDTISTLEYGEAVSGIVYSILFALIIVSQCTEHYGKFTDLSKLTIANKLGKYTYGIYLLHPIVLLATTQILNMFNINIDNRVLALLYAAVCLLLTLFVSKMSYDLFEKKFLVMKSRFSV